MFYVCDILKRCINHIELVLTLKIVAWGLQLFTKYRDIILCIAIQQIFFILKNRVSVADYLNVLNIFHLQDAKISSVPSHCHPFIFIYSPLFPLGFAGKGRVDWSHHSQAIVTLLLLVFLTHFLHACFKSGKKQTFGPEKQRSCNFLALVLGPWWSREHNVVIGARLTLGHGHCSRPKPN